MKKHQKHANIAKAKFGHFGRNEISIIGTPCGNIKKLSYEIIKKLSDDFKIGYIDADHKGAEEEGISTKSALKYHASKEYIDKINFHRIDTADSLNDYQLKQHFNNQDFVLVNGNHFKANGQIIVIDSKKPLEKKLDKLTNVELILFQEGETNIPEYLKAHVKDIELIPTYSISDIPKIVSFIKTKISNAIAPLKGLVLAGGKSERMQRDKGKIDYHGKEQRLFMYDILNQTTFQSNVSIRTEQSIEFSNDINTIIDSYIGLGPYGAILSAFMKDPNSAWLVTACDQPFLDEKAINYLISKRNPSKYATAFYNPETDFPEPLITIWEPKIYPQLLYFLSLGYSCPRKVLINTDIELVKIDDKNILKNANTPEELSLFLSQIN